MEEIGHSWIRLHVSSSLLQLRLPKSPPTPEMPSMLDGWGSDTPSAGYRS
jgi:hypothetical protein